MPPMSEYCLLSDKNLLFLNKTIPKTFLMADLRHEYPLRTTNHKYLEENNTTKVPFGLPPVRSELTTKRAYNQTDQAKAKHLETKQ